MPAQDVTFLKYGSKKVLHQETIARRLGPGTNNGQIDLALLNEKEQVHIDIYSRAARTITLAGSERYGFKETGFLHKCCTYT